MSSRSVPLVLVVCVVACTRASKRSTETTKRAPAPPLAAATPAPSSAAPDSIDARAAVAWPVALSVPALPNEKKPIAVAGYPVPLRSCLPDPAHHAGFTKDGREFGYCHSGMEMRCEFVDRDGNRRADSIGLSDHTKKPGDDLKAKEMKTWLAAQGVPELPNKDCKLHPPTLEGSWRFADISLSVVPVEGTFKKTAAGDEPLSEAVVKVGGALGGDKPVHPIVLGRPGRKPNAPARYSNGTEINVLALSPDGTELGIVTHTNCMEWCDEFEVVRMTTDRFASLVYNDAGFRAYEADDLDRAAELFLRAAYLDATRELPAYNLACVYAKKKDARAETALDLAIRRGGDPVRARARGDSDFASVKSEPWFTRLTGG